MRVLSSGSFSLLASLLAFFYVPIFLVIFFSFNASSSLSVWGGFSLAWYKALFLNEEIWNAVLRSLQVAFVSATVAVFLGLLLSILFARLKAIRFHSLFEGLSLTPLVVPEVLTGLAFLVFFVTLERYCGWPQGRGLSTVTIAHATLALAYTTLVLRSGLSELDLSLEEAALDLGAKYTTVFFTITLPLMKPSLVSAWLLAFVLSMDDLIIASFTTGPGSSTLPMVIFSQLKTGITPEVNALSSLIILVVLIISPVVGFFVYGSFFKGRRRELFEEVQ